jgi:glucose-6-phosphate isomerase
MDAVIGRARTWTTLEAHRDELVDVHLRTLFAEDPGRGERLTAEGAGLYLDYSKQRVTDETMRLLLALAEESGLRERIDAMFRGEKINVSEDRAVLHVALRAPRDASILVDGVDVIPQCTPCSTACRTSRAASARASGAGTPAGGSGM